jgi:hypothetical protein
MMVAKAVDGRGVVDTNRNSLPRALVHESSAEAFYSSFDLCIKRFAFTDLAVELHQMLLLRPL